MKRIELAITGTLGFIIVVDASDRDPGAPYDWSATATAVVVGQARVDDDGAKAWLWPHPTAYPGRGRSVHAVTAKTASDLAAALRKRHDEKGRWWQ